MGWVVWGMVNFGIFSFDSPDGLAKGDTLGEGIAKEGKFNLSFWSLPSKFWDGTLSVFVVSFDDIFIYP